ncbi:MAG: L-threonylcarbamoyladenylate synthase [Clostridiales bacterium]|nr:threonylcarbamoyl-AMP synthase [Clostridiales bacterium]MDU3241208.1 L-threonylcarbamoyladenylate synthase [Clostridiales bacterium]
MDTIIEVMDQQLNDGGIRKAGEILKNGGLVAFPTETVYGLGANALDERAAARIYEAKGRPSDNPLIVHIAEMADLYGIAAEVPQKAEALAKAFWPGPLTMIFKKNDIVPYGTTGGLDTVAVRMPRHELACALIRAGGGYIAAPSANTSGRPSPTKASHVEEDLSGKIDMIIDGGSVGIGLESTIVDMSEDTPTILRPGYINREMLEEVIGPVQVDRALLKDDASIHPKAPGMKYKHYAPKANLIILEGEEQNVISKINELIQQEIQCGGSPGVIASDETAGAYTGGMIKSIGTRNDELSIAQNLYGILREFDELEVTQIFSEAFETPKMGQAIMNRLMKAAGHQIIKV